LSSDLMLQIDSIHLMVCHMSDGAKWHT